jgi:hypothetical protein
VALETGDPPVTQTPRDGLPASPHISRRHTVARVRNPHVGVGLSSYTHFGHSALFLLLQKKKQRNSAFAALLPGSHLHTQTQLHNLLH